MSTGFGSIAAGGLSMGFTITLYDNYTYTANRIAYSMNGLMTAGNNLQTMMDDNLARTTTGLYALNTAIAGTMFMYKGLSEAGNLEAITKQFEIMLQSADVAKQLATGIQSFAALTPFEQDESLQAARMLLSTGMAADQVVDKLKVLGDVAAGTNINIERMAEYYRKTLNSGYAYFMVLNQTAKAGVPIWDYLAKMKGMDRYDLFNAVRKHKLEITSQEFYNAMQKMSSGTGIFANAMEKMYGTYKQRIATLRDYTHQMLIAMGQPLLQYAERFLEHLANIAKGMKEFFSTTLGKGVAIAAYALTGLLGIMGAVMFASGLLRISVLRLSLAYGANTMTVVSNAVAAGNLGRAWLTVGAAAWASAAPFLLVGAALVGVWKFASSSHEALRVLSDVLIVGLAMFNPYIAALGIVIKLLSTLNAASSSFDNVMAGKERIDWTPTHWEYKMQRMGGLIAAFKEAWASGVVDITNPNKGTATGNFTMSRELEKQGTIFGQLDQYKAIGQIVLNIKAVWEGFYLIISSFFRVLGTVVGKIMDVLKPFDFIFTIVDALAAGEERLNGWVRLGQMLGGIVLVMAAAWAVFNWEIILTYVALVGVYKIITWIIEGVVWVVEKLMQLLSAITNGIVTLLSYVGLGDGATQQSESGLGSATFTKMGKWQQEHAQTKATLSTANNGNSNVNYVTQEGPKQLTVQHVWNGDVIAEHVYDWIGLKGGLAQ